MLRKRRVSGVVALAGFALVAAACGAGGGGGEEAGTDLSACPDNPNSCNSAPVKEGGALTFAIEKNILNWNLTSADGNVFENKEALGGVIPAAFINYPDLKPHLNKDLLVSAKMTDTDPQTIEYKIQEDAVWNDGTPITADDFIYSWKTQNAKDCPVELCPVASTSGYDRVKSIEPSDGGKAFTVTYAKPYTDWKGLFAEIYPAHIAAKHGDLDTPKGLGKAFEWFGKNVPTYSGGPFQVANWENNKALALEPNPEWYGEGPHLDRLIFRIITDAAQEPNALANNEIQAMFPQPELDLVEQVEQIPDVQHVVGKGLLWEHFDFNLENQFLADETLRDAIFTAVDREEIIDKTVGQFAEGIKPLNNYNLMPQQAGYEDVVSHTGFGEGDVEKAKQMLTDAGYKIQGGKLITPSGETVPPMRILYTTGIALRKSTCELFAQQVEPLGLDVRVEGTDDLGGTLVEGDYDVIVFAWVGTPYAFAGAEQIWVSTSGSNFGHYKSAKVDRLVAAAASQTDRVRAAELLNRAMEVMSEDAYVLPLYQKPTFLAVQDRYANIRNNATNFGPPYNTHEWGIRKE